jgi:hypothetical protein
MLAEALAVLASTGGTALVTAMVTDGWEGLRGRFARLLGRGDARQTEAAAAALEQSRALLAGVPEPGLEVARAEQERVWQARLEELLEHDPGAERQLRALVGEVRALAAGSAGPVTQHAVAFDRAQQAVQGRGVQNATFGGQHDPGPGSG